jgi:Transcriptional regulators
MALKTINRSNVGDIVFEQIMQAIASGEWVPGSKMPSENELSDTLGVSRITVRGALQRLAALDIIDTRRGEGSFVKELDGTQNFNALFPSFILNDNDIFQMLEFRGVFECGSAAHAANNADEASIAHLEAALNGMKDDTLSSAERRQFDTEFHVAIGDATKNPVIIKVYDVLRYSFYASIGETAKFLGFDRATHYHTRILDAIKAKDSTAAFNAMQEHIMDTTRRAHEYLNTLESNDK